MQFRVRDRVEETGELARAIERFNKGISNIVLCRLIRLVGGQIAGLRIQFWFINRKLYRGLL
ncbi:hypothetical protein J2S45_001456 [Trueperella abortisuis]|uniref:Uncharacterized protein n=1 Tax=Trueperella abortisuis TaxID=445930 RepID=A0ABT9PJ80_9ACTO|nr:hypothetical protein [Trueperella abortisuis]